MQQDSCINKLLQLFVVQYASNDFLYCEHKIKKKRFYHLAVD